ncbi:class I SAM-dependent DNA methyltransferase [Planktothrix agardhii]|jgi:predicted TPR repeat methyltransferase|uniref:class I SAM-dependent DNA methyltransferase n=1 Tax=Planktothrix agardhii TaxID=1160 RepID=UPI002B20639E|nr:class I SAM-dependent methyltransferase [Planktothrix agardhii]MEA5563692.1 class I SAM-dependent methyltransferase [Planktothrix agardhii UHCC 0887]
MSQVDYQIRFPEESVDFSRDQEYFFVIQNGVETKYILQNYAQVYSLPKLYQEISLRLKCQSPETISMQLIAQLIKSKTDIESLVVLDIAAGTGLVGKHLASLGIKSIVGVDIIPEAAQAAQRDYPGIYEKYYVEDLTNITPTAKQELSNRGFNCLICCSSLSCHLPLQVFINSFNLISQDGWVAFNVSTYILDNPNNTEAFESKKAVNFSQLYHKMVEAGILEICHKHYYLHRYMTNGKPVNYVSVVARKRGNIPENW